jgi:glycosyltransferase involved in cell wall biosynthesis
MTRPTLVILPSIVSAGAELQAMLQIRELSRRGVPVRLMVLSTVIEPDVLAQSGLPDTHICRLRNSSPMLDMPFLRKVWRDLGRAAAFVRRHEVTDVIAHLPPSHFFARLLRLRRLVVGQRLRLFQYHHSEERRLNRADTVAKRAFYAIDGILARICDHTHWHVSQRVLADVSGGGFTRRDAVIHNTCDMTSAGDAQAAQAILAAVKSASAPYVVLLPGRLQARKGHQLLLAAARQLIDVESLGPGDIQLVVAGDGPHRAEIEAAVSATSLDAYVTLLGAVPHQSLLALYGAVDLVVIPSLIEGFGIVAIEALARGALVIASDAAGLDEIIRPGVNGLQFPVGDADALFDRLHEAWQSRTTPLIDQSAVRADMETRFGTEAHIQRLLSLLQQ